MIQINQGMFILYKMEKIKFRDKEMNLLEAKLYLVGLKTGIIPLNMNEKEKEEYLDHEAGKKYSNEERERKGKKGIWKLLNERQYLASQLNTRIQLTEHLNKIKYCKEHGHKEASSHIASGQGGTKVYAYCERCGMGYERGLTNKESSFWDKEMRTPMTI
jgi:hypothetical protein